MGPLRYTRTAVVLIIAAGGYLAVVVLTFAVGDLGLVAAIRLAVLGGLALSFILFFLRNVLRGAWQGRRNPARLNQNGCLSCGYALHGLPEPRCPECGTPFTKRRTPPLPPNT